MIMKSAAVRGTALSKANLKLLGLGLLWIVGGMFLLSLSVEVSPWLFLTIPLLMILCAILSYRVRWHRCGWSLIKRGIFVTPNAPRNCSRCGEEVA